ncbi:hypothetical protein [Lentzea sp. HUAS12]|uniref:hypothetical protein n=1 Tax=Lentzea sp. HUAS12 TaxID=2951806 RepID=UPI00209DC1C1|nr:hypothetical protein [Lentzea sp. HUAS12]USX53836.1 hypothetical protein ND450_06935 [Lentzea sp. HUAS12]
MNPPMLAQRHESERRQDHNIQTRRTDRELRSDLVIQVTDAAGSFHFLATSYWFMKETTGSSSGDHGYLEPVKRDPGLQYRSSRVTGTERHSGFTVLARQLLVAEIART